MATVHVFPEITLAVGVSGPEQTAITTGLRRRAYGDLADAGSPLGHGRGPAGSGEPAA